MCVHKLTDRVCNVGQNLAAAVGSNSGDFPLLQHIAGFIKVSDLDGGAAQIDAKAVFHGWILLNFISQLLYTGF